MLPKMLKVDIREYISLDGIAWDIIRVEPVANILDLL